MSLARIGITLGGLGLLAAPGLRAQRMTARDLVSLPQPKADTAIHYGPDSLQFGELRIPRAAGPRPVAVVIHGGCWMAQFGLDHARSEAEALRQAGLAVWSIEYRRVGNPGGGWPGTFEDVGAAIDHLRTLATRYPLDLGRVVLVGHSAGGHLALWAAARRNLPAGTAVRGADPLPVAGVVSLAGVPDLRRPLQATPQVCGDAVAQLLGDTSASRLRLTSPVELMPLRVPLEIMTGAEDAIVPPAWAREYGELATKAGEQVTVTVIPDAGHFEVVSPGQPAWKVVEAAVLKLATSSRTSPR